MNVAEYLVEFLYKKNVTDAFGVPGGVVLDFIYAMKHSEGKITPHLCFHEQAAGFAANGYAQTQGKLGVSYATRGPGVTNMLTAVADAYYDSIPVFYITAHGIIPQENGMRIEADQEFNPVPTFKHVTKYAVRIDSIEEVQKCLFTAYKEAMSGRKGPVLLDFNSKLFSKEIEEDIQCDCREEVADITEMKNLLQSELLKAKHPIFLIGDGINQAGMREEYRNVLSALRIPVLSSRFSQDIMHGCENYFGYVGSHATRYSNFILSKTDLIISVGNRMSFPVDSKSFKPIFEKAKVLRFDIDDAEFNRIIPNSITLKIELHQLLEAIKDLQHNEYGNKEWLEICQTIQAKLDDCDISEPVEKCATVLRNSSNEYTLIADAGNNEFWLSRAYAYSKVTNRLLFSKSFGALGCGLPKAVGAYYATRKPVIAIVGDQGLQINIQELQYISTNRIPIVLVVINNQSSGMIKDREQQKYKGELIHTTCDTGYGLPDLKRLADAYGIAYAEYDEVATIMNNVSEPMIVNIPISEEIRLEPNLPLGNACWELVPKLDDRLFDMLVSL